MATAILALVLVPLFEAFGTGLRTTRSVAAREIALLHARSKLAEAAGERPLKALTDFGFFDNKMTYEVTIEPLELPEQRDIDRPLAHIYEISVIVKDEEAIEIELKAIRSQYEEPTESLNQ